MSEVNESSRERYAANKRAFDDVFGDPFAKPEPVTGHYENLRTRGLIAAMKNNFDEGKGTRNPATPHAVDFFCDVESLVERNLDNTDQIVRFWETYVFGKSDREGGFNSKERTEVEQVLGRLLRVRRISPVASYFKVPREKYERRK